VPKISDSTARVSRRTNRTHPGVVSLGEFSLQEEPLGLLDGSWVVPLIVFRWPVRVKPASPADRVVGWREAGQAVRTCSPPFLNLRNES